MKKESILDLAFNLGMVIIQEPSGEIVIKTGLKYDNDTEEPSVVNFETIKPRLILVKNKETTQQYTEFIQRWR